MPDAKEPDSIPAVISRISYFCQTGRITAVRQGDGVEMLFFCKEPDVAPWQPCKIIILLKGGESLEEYESVYCFDSLYQAHKKARLGKQGQREGDTLCHE